MAEEKKQKKNDAAETPAPPVSKTDETVDRWFNETFYDRGIPTEIFNMLLPAKEELKKRLNKEA